MKNLKFFLILANLMLVSIFAEAADSYQHWVSWFQKDASGKLVPITHEATPEEMSDIYYNMSEGLLVPNAYKELSSGVVYCVPQPDLYQKYIERCVKTSRPSANTHKLVYLAIRESEQVQWGNDISVRVKNYWYSTVYKKVKYYDNYTGKDDGISVLIIDGTPTIKCDCGNPLEGINVVTKSAEKFDNTPPSPPAITETKTETNDSWRDYNKPAKTEQVNESVLDLGTPKEKEKISFFKTDVGKILTGAAIISVIYAVLEPVIWPEEKPEVIEEGGPVGAPTYPANTGNTGGGPTGAGTYGFNRDHNNLSTNMSQNLRLISAPNNGGLNLLKNGNLNIGLNSNMNNPVHRRSYAIGFSFKF